MLGQKKKAEQGSVLIMVVGILCVLAVIAVGLLRLTDAQTRIVQRLTGDDTSLYSAEKVSNQYLWEFNEDQNFAFLHDPNQYQKTITGSNVIYRRKLNQYETGATYRVEIVVPQEMDESGTLRESTKKALLRVTSWSPVPGDPSNHSLSKTIEVELAKRSFTQYGWITDSERDEENQPVYWRENDEFYGPLHTNGSLYLYYTLLGTPPAFFGKASYSESLQVAPAWAGHTPADAAADPHIFRKGVAKVEKIAWPVSNTYLISMAEAAGGHYYHGRTCILLEGSRYVVRSYDSQTEHWYYNGISYDYDAAADNDVYNDRGVYHVLNGDTPIWTYPTTGTATFQNFRNYALTKGVPLSIPLPENGVIYVDGDERNESLYTSDSSKFGRDLGNVFVSGTLNGKLTIGAKNDIFITTYDPTDWRNPWIKPGGLPSQRSAFSGFTETEGLKYGSTSFAHVYDAGVWDHEDVVPEDGSDILGLAAQQNIRVLHRSWPAPLNEKYNALCHAKNWGWLDMTGIDNPLIPDAHLANDATGATLTTLGHRDITIQAAMFCNTGSFGFEDPRRGRARGTMYVVGSVAQKLVHCPGDFDWTATINIDGYKRNMTHDPRMTYLSPPYFIEPTQAGFQTVGWQESRTPVTEP